MSEIFIYHITGFNDNVVICFMYLKQIRNQTNSMNTLTKNMQIHKTNVKMSPQTQPPHK